MLAFANQESKVTDRYQTTVPSSVRKQLQIGKGDRLRYSTDLHGRVYIENAREETDAVLGQFLDFIEADIASRPQRVLVAGGEFRFLSEQIAMLVDHVEVDLDIALSPDDE